MVQTIFTYITFSALNIQRQKNNKEMPSYGMCQRSELSCFVEHMKNLHKWSKVECIAVAAHCNKQKPWTLKNPWMAPNESPISMWHTNALFQVVDSLFSALFYISLDSTNWKKVLKSLQCFKGMQQSLRGTCHAMR